MEAGLQGWRGREGAVRGRGMSRGGWGTYPIESEAKHGSRPARARGRGRKGRFGAAASAVHTHCQLRGDGLLMVFTPLPPSTLIAENKKVTSPALRMPGWSAGP